MKFFSCHQGQPVKNGLYLCLQIHLDLDRGGHVQQPSRNSSRSSQEVFGNELVTVSLKVIGDREYVVTLQCLGTVPNII